MTRRLAVVCKASVKWVDGAGFQQYVGGSWLPVPAHTVAFVSNNLASEAA